MLKHWLQKIDSERLIHALKTAIAIFFGIILSKVVGFTADQWIVITIVVVMCAQIYVGGVIQKGFWRFLGTLTGCIVSILTFLILGDSLAAITICVCGSSFIYSYFATGNEKLTYACTLGATTTAIIMLGHDPSMAYAAHRFLEISVGILIATLISQFVLPIHARTHLRRTQAKTLQALQTYYRSCLMANPLQLEQIHYQDFDENIVKLLSKQRQLAKDSRSEPLGSDFNTERCVQLLQCEKEILRAMDFLHYALLNMQSTRNLLFTNPSFITFNQAILNYFDELMAVVENNTKIKQSLDFTAFLQLKTELLSLAAQASPNDNLYITGFCFVAEVLIQQIHKLASLYEASLVDERAPNLV